jgi:two-component system, chemotaxis family, sensor kinase CheA
MDLSKYLDLYVSEARNHISAFDSLIVSLEQNGSSASVINELFRHMHSLKGMSATMQFDQITELSHAMEDLLGRIRSNEIFLSPHLADLLLEGNDLISSMVTTLENNGQLSRSTASGIIRRISDLIANPVAATADDNSPQRQQADISEPATEQSQQPARQPDSQKSIRIKTDTLDRLVDITGELFTTRYQLAELAKNIPNASASIKQLSSLLRELREVVLLARMLPFSNVSERFPRLVRDLARTQNKDIAFDVSGKEIELDRGVLEEITEPLVHILRNAVDHGLESAEERRRSGKPEQGRITVSLLRDKDQVNIAVSDDGRGMDPEQLVAHAVDKGLISREKGAGLSRHEALQLICAPGFSTAATVSDISGRGVGMDAVRTAIQNLGGSLTIDSRKGLGSIFLLRLPISVSIIHALIVQSRGQKIALPVNTVDRTLELQQADLVDREGEQMFCLSGQFIPLFNLDSLQASRLLEDPDRFIPVILSGLDTDPFGVAVEQIIGQQEIFVKPLGAPLNHLHRCTGGSVTGDGSIIFVMDASALK